MFLCFLTPSFFPLEFTRRPMASGAGNGLGFFCFGSCRLACWSWNPVDGKDGSLLKQWEAVYVGYVLDPHQNLKLVTFHGKGDTALFKFVQLNDHVQVPFFWGKYVSVVFSSKNICLWDIAIGMFAIEGCATSGGAPIATSPFFEGVRNPTKVWWRRFFQGY